MTRVSRSAIRCCRARFSRALRRSSATWRRPAATCCSGRAATISTTSARRATNASPAAVPAPSTASTASTRSSARATSASRRIRPTCASRSPRSTRGAGHAARRASGRSPITDFHRLPGDTPEIDTNLGEDELITAVDLPGEDFAPHYTYLKLRDRLSYAFALVSVAAALKLDGDTIREARLALGGVAPKPWRELDVEAAMAGRAGDARDLRGGRRRAARGRARLLAQRVQVELARRAIVRALSQAAAGTPQVQTDKRVR